VLSIYFIDVYCFNSIIKALRKPCDLFKCYANSSSEIQLKIYIKLKTNFTRYGAIGRTSKVGKAVTSYERATAVRHRRPLLFLFKLDLVSRSSYCTIPVFIATGMIPNSIRKSINMRLILICLWSTTVSLIFRTVRMQIFLNLRNKRTKLVLIGNLNAYPKINRFELTIDNVRVTPSA